MTLNIECTANHLHGKLVIPSPGKSTGRHEAILPITFTFLGSSVRLIGNTYVLRPFEIFQ